LLLNRKEESVMHTDETGGPCHHRVPSRLLIVDDDPEMRELLAEVLTEEGYDVAEAPDGARALIRLRAEGFAAIILDKNMPGLSGLDLLPGIRAMCPDTPVIVITAFGNPETYDRAVQSGAYDHLFKPFPMGELVQLVRRALRGEPPQTASGPARPDRRLDGRTPSGAGAD
jgi:DNA-binding NtrC family response regulator